MSIEITCLTPINIERRTISDHFRLLQLDGHVRIRFSEFHLIKQVYWILKGREKSSMARVLRNIASIARILLSRDMVLVFGTEPFSIATIVANWLKRRHKCIYWTTWNWHDEDFSDRTFVPFRKRTWRSFLKGALCVAPTPSATAALSTYGARAYHIPHLVDTKLFRPPANRRESDQLKILFVGELIEVKGLRLIIELIRKHEWSDTVFLFAGRGPYESELRALASDGFPVEHLGFLSSSDLAKVYQNADMLILPSLHIGYNEENFGMVLTEAMACGLPVIASDCVGPKYVVEHEKNGLLIPKNDAGALHAAILRLAADAELREKMGLYGRKQTLETYDVEVVAKQWLEIINMATDGKHCLSDTNPSVMPGAGTRAAVQ